MNQELKIAHQAIRRAARLVPCPKHAEVPIVFISDAKMRKLNQKYRGKNKTTNVLAFPTNKSLALSELTKLSFNSHHDLGDILISLPEARREAKQYGWTLKYEIARLAVHGFLHLLGYDHKRTKEARVMQRIEAKVLANF